ncbi:MAG: hypothetical protein WKH64_07610 [Chloroflexia bacterium]
MGAPGIELAGLGDGGRFSLPPRNRRSRARSTLSAASVPWWTIAPAAVEVQRDHIRLESRYKRVLKLVGYPRIVQAGWLNPLIEFERPLEISLHITPLNVAEAAHSLKHRLGVLQTSRMMDADAGKLNDPDRDTALGDAAKLRIALARGEEKLFSVALYVAIGGDSLQELDLLTTRVEEEFERMTAQTRHTTYEQDLAFHAVLPEAADGIRAVRNLDTSSVATLIPFTSGSLSMEGGMMYGVTRHNRTLVTIDPFALAPNANAVIFAKSGGGKSYALKLWLLRNMYCGVDCYVIDPDREYETLCRAVGGEYIRLAVGGGYHINPLDLPVYTENEKEKEGLSSHVNELIGWLEICLPAAADSRARSRLCST